MANKFPLILNTSANQIQELASGDNLDLTGCGINNAGVITATSFSGNITGAVTGNSDTATLATNVTVTANNSTNETVYPLFVDGATGTQGAESDTGLTYNPSSGNLTSTQFTGTLQTAAQTNITSVGTLSALNVSGNGSIGGTLTYEDVTNIDAVGLVTARTGVVSPYADIDDWIDVGTNIQLGNAGIVTAKGADINGDIDVDGHTNLDNVNIAGVTTSAGAIDLNADLDVDGHTNLDNVSIAGVTTFTGAATLNGNTTFGADVTFGGGGSATALVWDKSEDDLIFADNSKAIFGTNSDGLEIYHASNHSYIADTGSGYLRIQAADYLQLGTASAPAAFLNCESTTGSVYIAHNGNDRIQTTNTGAVVTGLCTATTGIHIPDDQTIKIGNTSASPDLTIQHISSNSSNRIHATTGYIQYRAVSHFINDENNSVNFIRCEESSSNKVVKLACNGVTKLETKTDGVEITGNITANGGNMSIKTSDVDFIVSDPTDGTTNFIWRDHSSSRLYLGVSGTADIRARSSMTPHTSDLDLGDSSNRWRNIYTSDLDLSNESRKEEGGNEVDGTWGAYTIQEGEDDLFLINRRSGKKYKFNLTEVS